MLRPWYPIETERLVLRPLTAADLDDVHAYYRRPDVARFLYWDARDREESRLALEAYAERTAIDSEGDGLILAAVPREVGRVVGQVNLVHQPKGFFGDTQKTALDAALTWVLRFPR